MDKDDLWIVQHFSELVEKYSGKYVAVIDERVAASGESAAEVEAAAKRTSPDKTPSVLLIPREEDMACLL